MNIVKKVDLKQLIEDNVSHLDLFSYYYPEKFELNKRCRNVLVAKDDNPSMVIYYRDGGVFFKCYNSENRGDIWQFLMDYTQKSFDEVLQGVAEDFGLLEKSGKKLEKVLENLPKIEKKQSKPPVIKAERYKEFPERHLNYLKQHGLTPEDMNFCSDTEVFALKSFYMNGKRFGVSNKEVGFIYLVNKKYIKIYLPERPKGEKFWSNIPFQTIHGLSDLKNCENLIICKSIKEMAILNKYLPYCNICVQAENMQSISQEAIDLINSKAKNIYVSFDSDDSGVKSCKEITAKTGWNYINPPRKYLPLKDWADIVRDYGIEPVKGYIIKKIK